MGCIIGDFKHIVKIADNYSKQELKSQQIPVLPQHIIIFHLIGDRHLKFNDLQAEVMFSKSTLSDALNKYEELGLIQKFECDLDKRNVYLELSDEGKDVWTKLIEIDNGIRALMFKGLDQDEANQVELTVHKIFENLK